MSELATQREPWERREGEGQKAFNAFATFRDLGMTRTLPKTAQALGNSLAYMQELSYKHEWASRCEAYDLLLDRRRREATENEIEAMTRRHVAAGQVAQRIAIQRLQGDANANVLPLDPNDMDAGDAARLLDLGIKIERMSRGLPTEVIRGSFSIRPDELQTWMRDMMELALQFVPDDRRDAYINAVYALVEGRLR